MEALSTHWQAVVPALIAGIVIGYIIATWLVPNRQGREELEEHLRELKRQQQDYQAEVGQHFSRTAELLHNLADSYRDVHNHLAHGAETLCTEQDAPQLKALHDVKSLGTGGVARHIEPPRDYAPNKQGTLGEDYGLDKSTARDSRS